MANKRVIIATHGKVAEGFKDALSILVGTNFDLTVINAFTVDENPKATIEKIMDGASPDDEFIVFTDILGGSVNQMFVPYVAAGRHIHLITGTNLALLVELLIDVDSITSDSIKDAVQQARESIQYVNSVIEAKEETADVSGEEDFFA